MKTAAIASLLFAGAALAVPVMEKRGVQTEVVVTTIWTTTTVYVDEPTAGAFAEKHRKASSSSVSASSTSSAQPPPSSAAPAPSVAAAPSVAPAAPSVAAQVQAEKAPPAAAPASDAGAPSGSTHVGDATYYEVSNGAAGSCGSRKTDNDYVVALSLSAMNNGANSNNNPLCGRTINIQGENGVIPAEVYDSCEACGPDNIDLSPALFKAAFPHGDGRVHNVKWWFWKA